MFIMVFGVSLFVFLPNLNVYIMGSISETGHAKNLANFGKLITYVRNMGAVYQPLAI
jgi:hypothetical protein